MRIIFFGSSDFAVPFLEALKDKEEIVLVVTQPDRKKGRSQKIASTPVKGAAGRLGIETFQPDDVNCRSSIENLKRSCADLFIVVSFGQILSRELLDLPKILSVNVHASLLPKYRGAAPINWAIANGEKETGVTVMKMNERMDEGGIILKQPVPIAVDDDAVELSKKLSQRGVEPLLKSIDLIRKAAANFLKQDDSMATYAPKLKKQDGLIDWQWGAEKIRNRVRAFVPWPGCFTHWNKKILKIWRAAIVAGPASESPGPGIVLEAARDGILVSTGKGILRIDELQLEGGRRMSAEEFIAGHKDVASGSVFLLRE